MREWEQFLSELKQELGADAVGSWVPKLLRFDAGNVYLAPQDSFQAAWFEEHIRPRLKTFINANGRPIKVHLNTEKKEPSSQQAPPPLSFSPTPIDPEMSLTHFLPSPENWVPYKLLTEGSPFNPIFFYGARGSGKTHLLMGAALELKKKGKRVFYVKADTFTEHVVQAIRLGQMQEFRKIYRDIDALIVDDVHLFARKAATQEEFFHTFNTLHTSGRLVLLSAHVSPMHLTEIEPRLISRFEWGISLEVGQGNLSAILAKKAALWKMALPEELLPWIEHQFPKEPILALQALLLRSQGKSITLSMAEHLLKDLLEKERESALTADKIVKQVAAHYGIKTEDILGKSQMRESALPRQISMYLCRKELKMAFQKIGELFDRDHSTVMSSVKQIQKALDEKKLELPLLGSIAK